MKRISLIMLISVLLLSGCAKYTEKDLEEAYNKGWKECSAHIAELESLEEDEWSEGYERGYSDGLKESGNSYSVIQPTQYIYTGDEEAINDACAHIDDAYGCLNKAETEINIEYYDDALFYLDEARSEIIKALDILGY